MSQKSYPIFVVLCSPYKKNLQDFQTVLEWRLEEWKNGTEEVEVFRKRPEIKKINGL